MQATLIDERDSFPRPRYRQRVTVADRTDNRTPDRRHATQIVTEDKEAAMVARFSFAIALLGMTPLIVFLIIYYFFPDLLLFVDPPAK